MHLQHGATSCAEGQADKGQYATKLEELTAAAEAVTEAELLHMALPVLRLAYMLSKASCTSVQFPRLQYRLELSSCPVQSSLHQNPAKEMLHQVPHKSQVNSSLHHHGHCAIPTWCFLKHLYHAWTTFKLLFLCLLVALNFGRHLGDSICGSYSCSRLVLCRSHWLLAMQQEWQASQTHATQFAQLGKARQRRCWLETLHDAACSQLIQTNAKAWGAPHSN